MPLKKAVGAERRMDLASFFCMISRHGPAVALAVVAVVTVLAGFYIYRSVKERRRKAACDEGAVSPGEEEEEDRDAPVSWRSPHRPGESTDVKDAMEAVGNLRRRPGAAAEAKPPAAPPQSQTPESKPVQVTESCLEKEEEEVQQQQQQQQQQKELKEEEQPVVDDGDESRRSGREEESRCSIHTSQMCVMDGACPTGLEEVSTATRDVPAPLSCSSLDQPAEAEVEVLSAQTSSQPEEQNEEHGRSHTSVPAAEASEEGSSAPQKKEKPSEPSTQEPAAKGPPPPTPGGLCSPPSGASPPICDLQLSSEQMQKKKDDDDDNDAPSAGPGAESGISSLDVSPDLEVDGKVFPPQVEEVEASGSTEVQQRWMTSFQSSSQMFHSWTQPSSAANEDTFGHEIEDGYHSYYDRFEAQMSMSAQLGVGVGVRTSITSVQVVATEKSSVKKVEETEAEPERTEISIMEATMDTNEWITEGNAPPLPWMTPLPLDHPPASQAPSAETSAPPEAPPSAELPQTGLLFSEENSEHSKRVVAVPPMPQNVNVTFRVHYRTQSPQQTVAVTGDHPELGGWKEFLPLEKEEVKEDHWSAVVSLPSDSRLQWKFVLVEQGEVSRWEECSNRLLDTGLGDDLLVHEWWGLA